MAKVFPLVPRKPAKLGFKRVKSRRRRRTDPEKLGQLNLFSPPRSGSGARIIGLSPKTSPFEKALMLDEHDDATAYEFYQKAVDAGDRVADAYCNLGILESKAGRLEAAFDCFTKSLREDPRHSESHYNLGNLYFDMENLELARQHYRLAIQLEPSFPNVYFNLALILTLLEAYGEAIAALEKYRELAQDTTQADALLLQLKQTHKQ